MEAAQKTTCKHGHEVGPRPPKGESNEGWSVNSKGSSHNCRECTKIRSREGQRKRYRDDPERQKEISRRWCARNREQRAAIWRSWAERNKDRLRQRDRDRYETEKALYGRVCSSMQASARRAEENELLRVACGSLSYSELISALCEQGKGVWGSGARCKWANALRHESLRRTGLRSKSSIAWIARRLFAVMLLGEGYSRSQRTSLQYHMTPTQRAQYEAVKAMTFRYKKDYGWWDASKEGEEPWKK